MYVFHGVFLTFLFILLFGMLLRRRLWGEAVGLFLGLVCVGCWMVPFSLEYSWVFFIMAFTSILVLRWEGKKDNYLGFLFLVTGMVTAYLDFLTAETLTLLVPLLLRLLYRREKEALPQGREERDFSFRRKAFFHVFPLVLVDAFMGHWLCGDVGF